MSHVSYISILYYSALYRQVWLPSPVVAFFILYSAARTALPPRFQELCTVGPCWCRRIRKVSCRMYWHCIVRVLVLLNSWETWHPTKRTTLNPFPSDDNISAEISEGFYSSDFSSFLLGTPRIEVTIPWVKHPQTGWEDIPKKKKQWSKKERNCSLEEFYTPTFFVFIW